LGQGYQNSGKAEVRGVAVKRFRAMETYKNQKKSLPIVVFQFSNNIYLKNNNRNYGKPF